MNTFIDQGGAGQAVNSPSNHLMQYLKKRRFFWIATIHFAIVAIVVLVTLFMSTMLVDIFTGLITDPNLTWSSSISESQATVLTSLLYIMPILALIESIPSIVTGIAYLVIYLQAKKGKVPTVGVTILQVISALQLVSAIMMAFYAVIVGIIGLIAAIAASNTQIPGALIVVVIVLVVVAAIYFAYTIACVMLTSKIKKILQNRTLETSGTTLVGVVNIITAVICGVCIPFMVLMLCAFGFGNEFYYDNTTQRVLAIVLFAVLIVLMGAAVALYALKAKAALGVKRHMKKYDGPAITPQQPIGYYGRPPYNPNGFNNNPNNGYNPNGYNNGGYVNQNPNMPPQNNNTNTNPYQN